MKPLEDFLKPTQKQLYDMLRKMYKGKTIVRKNQYILVLGKAPIMLLAHLDTVHQEPVKTICKSDNGNILMSPQGIGGDDRCGVYALVNAYEAAKVKPWLLFTCDEEVGGIGAEAFCMTHEKGKLPKAVDELKLLVEIDRKGSKDAVYYDCDNKDFEAYITSKGFVTAFGSFSDISYIAPELGVAAVNLSSGYYNAHTLHEFISRKTIDKVVAKVGEIIADAARAEFPKYEYVEKVRVLRRDNHADLNLGYYRDAHGDWHYRSLWDNDRDSLTVTSTRLKTPKDLPVEYQGMYDELLDLYDEEELELLRKTDGDGAIAELYAAEYGPFYGPDSEDIEGG